MEFEKPDSSAKMKVLIFGANGVGKTVASTTAPGPVLIVDAEGGILSIRDRLGDKVKAVKVETFGDLREIAVELKTGKLDFATVVFDSLTEIQKRSMDEIMSVQKDKDLPAMRDWYANTEEIRKFVRFTRDLPMNVIFTCLPKDDKDEERGSVIRKPSLSGKLPEEVCGYVDEVLYLFTKEEDGELKRYFLTQPTEKVYAKDRSGKLERFEPPDLGKIHGKIFKAPKGGKK